MPSPKMPGRQSWHLQYQAHENNEARKWRIENLLCRICVLLVFGHRLYVLSLLNSGMINYIRNKNGFQSNTVVFRKYRKCMVYKRCINRIQIISECTQTAYKRIFIAHKCIWILVNAYKCIPMVYRILQMCIYFLYTYIDDIQMLAEYPQMYLDCKEIWYINVCLFTYV